MKKENLSDKLNKLDAQSVTPQEFEQVWGYTKEEYLDRMMAHVQKRKAEELLKDVAKDNARKKKMLDLTKPDAQDWMRLTLTLLQEAQASDEDGQSRVYLKAYQLKEQVDIIRDFLSGDKKDAIIYDKENSDDPIINQINYIDVLYSTQAAHEFNQIQESKIKKRQICHWDDEE